VNSSPERVRKKRKGGIIADTGGLLFVANINFSMAKLYVFAIKDFFK
jgi:hypothetical protein